MIADQLISELAQVAPADANKWRDLRAAQIAKLSADDNARVYREWRKLARLNPNQ